MAGSGTSAHRQRAKAFVDLWRTAAPEVSPQVVAAILGAACETARRSASSQRVELVWTGPEASELPYRRTDQALLQVIISAESTLTVVSYAVYKVPDIGTAIVRAADRSVSIAVVLETPSLVEGRSAYNTVKALGPSVAERCRIYYWPEDERPKSESGKHGLLRAKAAVADRQILFVSSANLTEYAFTLNLELGVLVTGGALPGQVSDRIRALIGSRTLEPV